MAGYRRATRLGNAEYVQNMQLQPVSAAGMPKRKRQPGDKQSVPQLARTPSGGAVALTLPQATQRAVAAYQRADWTEAERLCRLILSTQSDNVDALHLLGLSRHRRDERRKPLN